MSYKFWMFVSHMFYIHCTAMISQHVRCSKELGYSVTVFLITKSVGNSKVIDLVHVRRHAL